MRIILFRHAERDLLGSRPQDSSGSAPHSSMSPTKDPGLNERGQAQAQGILRLVQSQRIAQPEKIICSPKRRARETLSPTADFLSIKLTLDHSLDERSSFETGQQFSARVKKFLLGLVERIEQEHSVKSVTPPKVVFLISHLDFLEEALIHIPCNADLLKPEFSAWQTAQFLEFEITQGLWELLGKGRP